MWLMRYFMLGSTFDDGEDRRRVWLRTHKRLGSCAVDCNVDEDANVDVNMKADVVVTIAACLRLHSEHSSVVVWL